MGALPLCFAGICLPLCIHYGVNPDRGTQDCCFWFNIIYTATCACCSFLGGLLYLLSAMASSRISDEQRRADCNDDPEAETTCYQFSSLTYVVMMIVECVLVALYITSTVKVLQLRQTISNMYQARF